MSNLTKNYNRKKIAFKKGKGTYLFSTKGEKYLDFVQGIALNSLGHAHPKLVKLLINSLKSFGMYQTLLLSQGEELAKKFQKNLYDYVLFQNSLGN